MSQEIQDAKPVDVWEKEGYFHFKHSVDDVNFVLYMSKNNSTWIHAFEGAFDLASMFKGQIAKAKMEDAKKKAEAAQALAEQKQEKVEMTEPKKVEEEEKEAEEVIA